MNDRVETLNLLHENRLRSEAFTAHARSSAEVVDVKKARYRLCAALWHAVPLQARL